MWNIFLCIQALANLEIQNGIFYYDVHISICLQGGKKGSILLLCKKYLLLVMYINKKI